jgi:3-oxoacyl-(acyl-carrier-protein) synthase
MTAGNPEGVRRCIQAAIKSARIEPSEIDLISGHLTATRADPVEVCNWRAALNSDTGSFPLINAPKSLIGHTLGAAGAIESVASVLQIHEGFVHPSINCEDLHPGLEWCRNHIPHQYEQREIRTVAKAAFGFGDINACIIFRQFQ